MKISIFKQYRWAGVVMAAVLLMAGDAAAQDFGTIVSPVGSGLNYRVVTPTASPTVYGEVEVAANPTFSGAVTIPRYIIFNGFNYNVIGIREAAFKDNTSVTGLNLASATNLKYIGWYAFENCSNLTGNLVIPNSVTTIGWGAFRNANFTGSLTIPGSVTDLGHSAFEDAGFTGDLTISAPSDPAAGMHIRGRAFYNTGFTGSLTIGSPNVRSGITIEDRPGAFVNTKFTGNLTINSMTTVPEQMFSGIDFKGTLTIGDMVTYIGGSAFANTGFTGNLVIPNSVTFISTDAFLNCSGFTGNLVIPNLVTYIGWSAFRNTGFTGTLTIPSSVTYIGFSAFENVDFTGDLTIPAPSDPQGMFIRNSAFANTGFTGNLTIGSPNVSSGIATDDRSSVFSGSKFTGNLSINSMAVVSEYLFSGLDFKGTLTIGNSVTTIRSYAFANTGFTGNLVIPASVTYISNDAFLNCSGFTGSLTIPGSVTVIGSRAFSGCSGFAGDLTISAPSNPAVEMHIYGGAFHNTGFNGNLTIGSSDVSSGVITTNEVSGAFSNTKFAGNLSINSMTTIPRGMFLGAEFEGTLTIGNSVTSIGESAFTNTGFTGDLVIPNSVTSIGTGAFRNTGFTGELVIPNSVTSIGTDAFLDCSGFTGSLVIPSSVTSIGLRAFSGCTGFTGDLTISAPSAAGMHIFNSAFANTGFTGNLTIGSPDVSSGITIDEATGVFSNAKFIGNLSINSMTTVPRSTFSGLGFKGTLTIGNSVTSIGTDAFNSTGFTGNLVIPDLVTSIGAGAFRNTGFTGTLTIPNSVTSIGGDAFWDCSGFTGSLTIPSSVTSIGSRAFLNCSGFTGNLVIPNSVTSIGTDAFANCTGLDGIESDVRNLTGITSAFSGITSKPLICDADIAHAYRNLGFTNIVPRPFTPVLALESGITQVNLGEEFTVTVDLGCAPPAGLTKDIVTVTNGIVESLTYTGYNINNNTSLRSSVENITAAIKVIPTGGDAAVQIAGGAFQFYNTGNSESNVVTMSVDGTPALITAAPITGVASPVVGALPSVNIDNGAGFTSAIVWSGVTGAFDYAAAYTATVTLTVDIGYTFAGGLNSTAEIAGFTVNGAAPVFVSNSGSSLVFTVTFPDTEKDPALYRNNFADASSHNGWELTTVTWVNHNQYGTSLLFQTGSSSATTPAILDAAATDLSVTISAMYGNYIFLHTSPDGVTFTDQGLFTGVNAVAEATKPLPDGTRYLRFVARSGTSNDVYLISMIIMGTPADPVQDNADITVAKAAVEGAAFNPVNQTNVTTIAQAKSAVEAVITTLSLNGVTAVVTDGAFTAATAGTVSNLDGTDGSYTFTVTLNKGAGTQQITNELTMVITANPYDPAQDNADITFAKSTVESATFGPAAQTNVTAIDAARAVVENALAGLELNGVTASIVDGIFTAAVEGTVSSTAGTNGSYTFTVTLNKGAGIEQITNVLTMVITADQYDSSQDNADITVTKSTVESATFGPENQADVTTIAQAKSTVEAVIATLSLNGVTAVVIDGAFTAATAGTVNNLDGTNGSYTFTVTLNKGAGTQQVTNVLTLTITAEPYDPTQDNADITVTKSTVESATFGPVNQANVTTIAQAKSAVEAVITTLSLNGVTAVVVDGAFTAATAGTVSNITGTNGSYTFTVTLNKGAGTPQVTIQLSVIITANPYDPAQDNADITVAKSAIEGATFGPVNQTNVTTIAQAKSAVEAVITTLSLNGVTAVVVDGAFTAATAGTVSNITGTNGSYTFTVTLNKGAGTEQTTGVLTLTITAEPYNPPVSYRLTTDIDGQGTININPSSTDGSYAAGTVVTLTTTPEAGWTFAGWRFGTTGSNLITTPELPVTMNSNQHVVAVFTETTSPIISVRYRVADGNSGIIRVQDFFRDREAFTRDTVLQSSLTMNTTITAMPQTAPFMKWSDDYTNPARQVTADFAHGITEVIAYFGTSGGTTFALTTDVDGQGTINRNPSTSDGRYDIGTVVKLTATPAAGWTFSGWRFGTTGSGLITTPELEVLMTRDQHVVAVFTQTGGDPTYTLSVTTQGNGTFNSNPSIFNGANLAAFPANTQITLIAQPAQGWEFSNWVENGTTIGDAPGIVILLTNSNRSVTAVFTQQTVITNFTFTYRVSGNGSGKIRLMQSGTTPVEFTDTTIVSQSPQAPAVMAVPGSGSHFVRWSDGSANPARTRDVITSAAGVRALNFTAYFERDVIADNNLLTGGAFTDEKVADSWSLETSNENGAIAAGRVTDDGEFAFNIIQVGTVPEDVRFTQENITVEPAKKYTLSFMARADAVRTVFVTVDSNDGFIEMWKITLTPELQEFSETFTTRGISMAKNMQGKSPAGAFEVSLSFNSGHEAVNWHLSEVNLVETGAHTTVLSPNRVPQVKPGEGAKATASVSALSGKFTAGPNPVAKSAGTVNFFWQGKKIQSASLTVFDAAGNVVSKVQIKDGNDNNDRRIVGSWDLTDRRGRAVIDGTYLVRGTITDTSGKKERISLMIGVR